MQKNSAFQVAIHGRPKVFQVIVLMMFIAALLTTIVCSILRFHEVVNKKNQKAQMKKKEYAQPNNTAILFTNQR